MGNRGDDADVFEFGDLGIDEGMLVFEVGEFVEEGGGVSAFGDGAGEVGYLGVEFFLFGVQCFELCAFFVFDMCHGASFNGDKLFEGFGDEDVVVEGVEDGAFQFFASDASLGAACATFGAGAAVGFVSSFGSYGIRRHGGAAGGAVDEA